MITGGSVIWVTGLSGAGKTTVATALGELMRTRGAAVLLLDGDVVRRTIDDPHCGHDHASRLVNAYRMSRLARLGSEQGLVVIVSTMSMFHEIHRWNREHLADYYEVFLEVDIATLTARDPKGLYAKVAAGLEANVPGIHIEPELPRQPHIHLDNNDSDPTGRRQAQEIYDRWSELHGG